MSDNSTGSTGSSSNSWSLLSPEEVAEDPAAPVDDGTESLGDAPSISEEIAGSSVEVRLHDPQTQLAETILSEEGRQICQETAPEFFKEMAATDLAGFELDPDIHAPIIHDTITSSPPDSDLLGAVPFSIASEPAFQFSEESAHDEPTEEDITDVFPSQHVPIQEGPTPEPEPKITSTPVPFRELSPSQDVPVSEPTVDISPTPEIIDLSAIPILDIQAEVHASPESPPLADTGFGSTAESPAPASPYPETIGSAETEEEPSIEKEEMELPEKIPDVLREPESLGAEIPVGSSVEDDGLRLRHVQPTIVLKRSSDEEDDEEEEFNLPEKKEEKPGFSLNQLIVGALVLLCLGSFFFSGSVVDQSGDDFDGSELSDQELLDKFAQENKQINILEAQIESQKNELDIALKMAADAHSTEKGVLENENTKLKEQLSELPGLKEELHTLRARVAELAKLTVAEELPQQPSTGKSSPAGTEKHLDKNEELKRQKVLLEESGKRLQGMKKQDWNKQGLRESLVEMQKRLSKQVDQLGKREEWKRKHQEYKEEKKEWGKKKEHDSRWKEEMERGKEWKHGKDKKNIDYKRKEHLKKYKEEWDHKKDERRMERERRQRDRPWQGKASKHQHQHHHHEQADFWKHQEEKLRRNRHPAEGCRGVDNCADIEGLVPVKLAEFQDLLEVYLSKLEGVPQENKEALSRLTAQFFNGGVFAHDRMLFSKFAEDVADILEDLADALESEQHGKHNDSHEEEMEEFEKEALLRFSTTVA
ncbi:pre-B-cell leukemia transcription factor-interacting protein 1-like isoform X2 [Myxocyprinus asiaticus]|uniref:pre-B-cell leukemia transcription factor-interacting protein 1-like isoform X2 n=1 Tax=Myxocyprinus asiaticus TaxID=70543 RepID=UPI002221819F|nr:pre-B-cell leukemia transcription factor-interacting protein 1-like isoform X2 [Myxocyprinus asiaticus]